MINFVCYRTDYTIGNLVLLQMQVIKRTEGREIAQCNRPKPHPLLLTRVETAARQWQ